MTPDSREHELRQLKEALAPSSACATIEELAALADASLAAPLRSRIAAHVASCERCEVELALFKEFESASPRAEEQAAVEWIVTRLRRRFREARVAAVEAVPDTHEEEEGFWGRLFRLKPMSAVGFGLAAAMLLVAVNLELREGREPTLPTRVEEGAQILRSNALELRSPAGDLDAPPAELRWEPIAGAASYSIEVMEVDRTTVWKADVAGSPVALPDAVRERLVPGKPLLWKAQAKDAAGRTLATSPLQRFRVKTRNQAGVDRNQP
jgi:hypothetical protein